MTALDRSQIMRAVRHKDTAPELIVRKLLHIAGYRYRLHRNDLPGKPDLTFPSRKKIIFVHGCFWHGHNCKRGSRVPKSNTVYWQNKIANNQKRDAQHQAALGAMGWSSLIVWECELLNTTAVLDRFKSFLDAPTLKSKVVGTIE